MTEIVECEQMNTFTNWMTGVMQTEKGGYVIFHWVAHGASAFGLGTLGQPLVFHETVLAVARFLQKPFDQDFRVKKTEELKAILDAFLALLEDRDLLIAAKHVVTGRLGR